MQRGRQRLVRLLRQWRAPSGYSPDPLLPHLPKMLDVTWVAELFERDWPGRDGETGRSVRVHRCDRLTARHLPGMSCRCTYALDAESPGQGRFSTIGVVETTTEGSRHRLFSPDPELPFLDTALDQSVILSRLGTLPAVTESWGAPESLTITPVRYWPGSRCTLRYDLHSPAGSLTCYGKVLASIEPWLAPALDALYEHSQSNPRVPRVPRLFAYWPELHMLLLQGLSGEPLRQRVLEPLGNPLQRGEWLQACGAGLAALQECQHLQLPVRTLSQHAAALYGALSPLAALHPAWAKRAQTVLETLQEMATAQAEPPPVASHGAFRISKLLVVENSLALTDLDTLCLANPASDVASFLAHLEYQACHWTGWLVALAEAKHLFLLGYRQGGGRATEGWLRLYQAAELLRQTFHTVRNVSVGHSPRAIEQLLDQSMALLGCSQ
ncbi:MAG: hypothetical protein FJ026_06975 [Chloroflexi bacterium]|nr:hypothetical protein [Chloroflexota bacterium]